MSHNYLNIAAIALNEAIENKRFALRSMRTSTHHPLKKATIERLAAELRALEMQVSR